MDEQEIFQFFDTHSDGIAKIFQAAKQVTNQNGYFAITDIYTHLDIPEWMVYIVFKTAEHYGQCQDVGEGFFKWTSLILIPFIEDMGEIQNGKDTGRVHDREWTRGA